MLWESGPAEQLISWSRSNLESQVLDTMFPRCTGCQLAILDSGNMTQCINRDAEYLGCRQSMRFSVVQKICDDVGSAGLSPLIVFLPELPQEFMYCSKLVCCLSQQDQHQFQFSDKDTLLGLTDPILGTAIASVRRPHIVLPHTGFTAASGLRQDHR